jgi:plasmid stability protein
MMPSITIKDIPEDLVNRLRRQAAHDKRSMNAEGLRFIARIEQRARFEGVAVIASSAWEAECNRFQEIMNCPVRRFSPSARRSAEAWLEAV